MRTATIIGLGSMLMADDGLGLAAIERLQELWELPRGVEVLDGGTWGMNLLPDIESADQLILVDAINAGVPAGSEIRLDRDQLPRYLSLKVSPHQIDLSEVLALADLRGTLPPDTVALGLQPEEVILRASLSPLIAEKIDGLVQRVVDQLAAWGYVCTPRTTPRPTVGVGMGFVVGVA